MKKLVLIISLLAIWSCTKIVPIKGSYQLTPVEVVSTKSKDEVWSKVIDLFAQKGLPIRLIDKSSGLIISDKVSLLNQSTWELPDGKLSDPNAWVVVEKLYSGDQFLPPTYVTGEWNVRVKEQDSKTIINVNLLNLQAGIGQITPTAFPVSPSTSSLRAQSLGNFERYISDIVK